MAHLNGEKMSTTDTALSEQVEAFADQHDLSDDEYTRLIDAVHVIQEYEHA